MQKKSDPVQRYRKRYEDLKRTALTHSIWQCVSYRSRQQTASYSMNKHVSILRYTT